MKLFDFLIRQKEKAKFEKTIIAFANKQRLIFTHFDKDNEYHFQSNSSKEVFYFKRSDILLDLKMEVSARQIIIWFRNKAEQQDYKTFVKTR